MLEEEYSAVLCGTAAMPAAALIAHSVANEKDRGMRRRGRNGYGREVTGERKDEREPWTSSHARECYWPSVGDHLISIANGQPLS